MANSKAYNEANSKAYNEKIVFLRRYLDAQRAERRLIAELAQLRAGAAGVSRALSGMPPGGGDGQAIPRAVERIAEAQNRLAAAHGAALDIRQQVRDAIYTAPTPLWQEILSQRYIIGQPWEQIAATLGCSLRQVLRLHHAAVEHIQLPDSPDSQGGAHEYNTRV